MAIKADEFLDGLPEDVRDEMRERAAELLAEEAEAERTVTRVDAVVTADGLTIDGRLIVGQLPLERWRDVPGQPDRTIEAGPPAPYGYRNNQIHVYNKFEIYLNEHHASRLIQEVRFVFDPAESPFPVERAFDGRLEVDGRVIRAGMSEREVESAGMTRGLPGTYHARLGGCWVGVDTRRRRDVRGKRRGTRRVVSASVRL